MGTKGSLEITTAIGCKVNCDWCPQSNLINSYKSANKTMSFKDFKICIDKVPKTVQIDFSGMCEPFQNENCIDMIEYAVERFEKVVLYTTFIGINEDILNRIYKIKHKLNPIMIHVADESNHSKINVDENYLKMVDTIYKLFPDKAYCAHGNKHPQINIPKVGIIGACSRGGNLKSISDGHKTDIIYCGSSGFLFNRNILLPNGDLLLCCMDYSQKYIIGNLLKQEYKNLHEYSPVLNELKNSLISGKDAICRDCQVSRRLGEK